VTDFDALTINTIRGLAIDAVQAANSGHPGTPMGIAPVAYALWQRRLRFDPEDPIWPNRDRFVLSEGHASALLWALLYLTKVRAVDPEYEIEGRQAVTLEDLRTFRQLGSKCPGHPEYRWTSGVETTTGPLGQGCANSVGMALAGRWLAARYNRPDFPLFDFDVYAMAGDGDMMEGISSEAASFAAHQGLHKLCWIYDSNRVSIDGHTDITFTEDVAARFLAYGWNVTTVADANNLDAIDRAFGVFAAESRRPTLIVVHSHIGYGSPVEDSPKAHGEPLGVEGVRSAKEFLGLPVDRSFYVPDGVADHLAAGVGARGARARGEWEDLFEAYREKFSDLADELDRIQRRELPDDWAGAVPRFDPDPDGVATRVSSGKVLNAVAQRVPWLLGGSADLATSTKTTLTFDDADALQAGTPGGRNVDFGVREHAAAAISNGIAVTKLRPFWSSFLTFTDYARPAIRLSALMEIPVIHVLTHDSIGLGQDGPTHQPVEQLASLRAMPGLLVFRPADANEVVECWRVIMPLQHEAAMLVLSRQDLPTLDRSELGAASGVARGAYVLAETPLGGQPDVLLLATGSEVHLALKARTELAAEGIGARVVSMPCWALFDRQPQSYRDQVLPPAVRARVAVEQASTFGWDRWVGPDGAVVGMHTFGASAPLKQLMVKFGFTEQNVTQTARDVVASIRRAPMDRPDGSAQIVRTATEDLHDAGQSLWLDSITRTMLDDGTLQRYIDHFAVTGLTSNPSIFGKAIDSGAYDDQIRRMSGRFTSAEEVFLELAIDDLRRAADLFRPTFERTEGMDGWVSLEVSPTLAHDTKAQLAAAIKQHARADRPNLLIKIPGTPQGLPAITEAIAAGVPINVTLLFDADQYRAAADAYMTGVERRLALGLDPVVGSVASVFVSRWDKAVRDQVPEDLHNQLGLAIAKDAYRAYREVQESPRWQRLAGQGAKLQRLLFGSTSTKDASASDTLYVSGLAAPLTINTIPEPTLEAFQDHGTVGEPLSADGGDADAVLALFESRGVDVKSLAAQLQEEGAAAFVDSWTDLIAHIENQMGADDDH